jgi:hypothetical protein
MPRQNPISEEDPAEFSEREMALFRKMIIDHLDNCRIAAFNEYRKAPDEHKNYRAGYLAGVRAALDVIRSL